MEMGIAVSAYALFGMLALFIFTESLEEPTQQEPTRSRVTKAKPRLHVNDAAHNARTRKKVA